MLFGSDTSSNTRIILRCWWFPERLADIIKELSYFSVLTGTCNVLSQQMIERWEFTEIGVHGGKGKINEDQDEV